METEYVLERRINTDIMPRIGHLDNIVSDFEEDIKYSVASNSKAISDVQKEVAESINRKLKPIVI